MLSQLSIENVALIEKAQLNLDDGLNILSGETGAGKSMLIDSLLFVLGAKTSKDFVRKGASQAKVTALFFCEQEIIGQVLQELDIPPEEDGALLLSRTLSEKGKSVSKINGTTVTMGMLKNVSRYMMDIHGQHQHQSLFQPANHMELLDRFCGPAFISMKTELGGLYKQSQQIKEKILVLSMDEKEKSYRLDMLKFQVKEIEDAKLLPEEEEELLEARNIAGDTEKILSLGEEIKNILYDSQDTDSALDQMAKAQHKIEELAQYHESMKEASELIESAYAQLDEAVHMVRRFTNSIESAPYSIDEIESRLHVIYQLKRKYGPTIADIIAYGVAAKEELEQIESSQDVIEQYEKELLALEKKMNALSLKMTGIRKKKALAIEKMIEEQLHQLGMKKAHFQIQIEPAALSANGKDKIEFMIAPNPGEEMKALARIGSGGEISRVMLALKTVLAGVDIMDSFVFDEIDTGVSGRTAQKVAEKLSFLAQNQQIICITHLPQIAAMADQHFLIEKKVEKGRTTTTVSRLTAKEEIQELARLLGGAKITETTLKAAKEMKDQAINFQKSPEAAKEL